MVIFACVKVGARYGDDYVHKLKRGIERFCKQRHEFVCFTDKPIDGIACRLVDSEALPGWWSKLELFKAREPFCYFDLDVVITGDLTRFVEWDGFGILKDPWLKGYGSGVMKLTGNEGHVWDKFRPGVMGLMRGDQDWLNVVMPEARTFPDGWFPSLKADACIDAPPEGAMSVSFHGFPKMHQISSGWVPDYWR